MDIVVIVLLVLGAIAIILVAKGKPLWNNFGKPLWSPVWALVPELGLTGKGLDNWITICIVIVVAYIFLT